MESDARRIWREAFSVFKPWLKREHNKQRFDAADGNSPPCPHIVNAADGTASLTGDLTYPAHTHAQQPSPLSAAQANDVVGPYRLEHPLGSGGMGEVWHARRDDKLFEKPVALKLLHTHLPPSARERFVREGRILGQLAHPNIALLLDAGVADGGRLYLAIEYVEGRPLDRWCDERRLDIASRIRLFLQVCDAIAYAHAHLVVHRDLKPANVLVTAQAGVKLLDFGIAKLLESTQGRAPEAELTRVGERALTPQYAAPEQITGETVTVATDVYSLGVLLYLLLCGRRPYGRPGATLAQLERQIVETEAVMPSRSMADDAAEAAQIAALRGTTPTRLRAALAGDLDTILLKALKKRPAERYPSSLALSDDLRRYLDLRPVLARPDSRIYRGRKYLRRHRLGAAAALVVAMALSAGLAATVWQASIARREAENALAQAARANATRDFLVGLFRASDPRIAVDTPRGQITARELLDRGATRIEADLSDQPELQIELLGLITDIYELLNEGEPYERLRERRAELALAHYGRLHPVVLDAALSEANAATARQDYEKATQLLADLDERLRASDQDHSLLRANWWEVKRLLLLSTAGGDEQIAHAAQQALRLQQELAPHSTNYASELTAVALTYSEKSDYREAIRYASQALEVFDTAPDRADTQVAALLGNMARDYELIGDAAGADKTYDRLQALADRISGGRDPIFWRSGMQHARMLLRHGDIERGNRLALQMLKAIPEDWVTSNEDQWARGIYAECLTMNGRFDEAIPILEATLRSFVEHDYAGMSSYWKRSLGDAYDRAGRVDDARRLLRASLDEYAARQAPESKRMLGIRERWGRLLLDHPARGDADIAAAETEFRTVVDKAGKQPWLEPALAQTGLARIALLRGDIVSAQQHSGQALAALERTQEIFDIRMKPPLWLVHSAVMERSGDAEAARLWKQKALDLERRYAAS